MRTVKVVAVGLMMSLPAMAAALAQPPPKAPHDAVAWQQIDKQCRSTARQPAGAIAQRLAQGAVDEYFTFGGHEIDADGRLFRFGLVESEQQESEGPALSAKVRDLGWWHVFKYWRHLPAGADADTKPAADADVFGQLRTWVYEGASRTNTDGARGGGATRRHGAAGARRATCHDAADLRVDRSL